MLKICYNPFSDDFLSSYSSHSTMLYNKGCIALFDEYIRGIIIDNTLYLRTYYPFKNINDLSLEKLNNASYTLLLENADNIKQLISAKLNINVSEIKYNVTNDLLQGIGLIHV